MFLKAEQKDFQSRNNDGEKLHMNSYEFKLVERCYKLNSLESQEITGVTRKESEAKRKKENQQEVKDWQQGDN